MTWQNILGHDRIVQQFRRALQRGRLASTFLFVGPNGIGKKAFALKLAQGLLCDEVPPQRLEPCGHCAACQQVLAGTHPDVEVVGKPPDKAFIPLALLIGEDERRMREGLCYNLSLKPFSGKRRVAIIDDADYLNAEGANCLLKTLEEPPPGTLLILISTSEQRQLPTIRSRCQAIRFRPLTDDDVAAILVSHGLIESPDEATRAASLGSGSLERALEATDAVLGDYQAELVDQLSRREFDIPSLAKATTTFVDSAGKEAPAKRARLKQAVAAASTFYRELMLSAAASGKRRSSGDWLDKPLAQAQRWWPGGDEAAALCLEVCLDTTAAIEANANQATLVECWLDELATIGRTGRPV